MITTLSDFPSNVLAISGSGQITRGDYRDVVEPAVEKLVRDQGKIRVYYRIEADYAGIAPTAIWEDFKVGMSHLSRWERVAVVTDIEWIRHTVRLFGFMIPAEIRTFPLAEAASAREWIVAA
jgi:hypothetical protein